MTVPKEVEAKILHLYKSYRWKIGTISSALGVHHSVVRRVLEQDGRDKVKIIRKSIVDPYKPFILEKLTLYPKIAAISLYRMAQTMGYKGGRSRFTEVVQSLRPKPGGEAFLRRKTLIGEEGQVDWAHFGEIQIGAAKRKLYAFVMVCSWSRMLFFRFCTSMEMSYFLRGHELALKFFNGVPKCILYDNLKSVVKKRVGDAIEFNREFLEFSGYYGFEAKPVGICRGNEKGRVERAIRFIRRSFWEGLSWTSIEDLNQKAMNWCINVGGARKCPEGKNKTVMEAFSQEQEYLLSLPDNPWPTDQRMEVRARKQPYVRFDLNDYSVPFEYANEQLVIYADEKTVRIVKNDTEIASHQRCYSKDCQIENPDHIQGLKESKRKARGSRGRDHLLNLVPSAEKALQLLSDSGENLSTIVRQFNLLLDEYNPDLLEQAIEKAIGSCRPHPNSVRTIITQWCHRAKLRQKMPVALPDDERVQNMRVKPHRLDEYDYVANEGAE